jgi:hypothetical protein
MVQIGTSDHVHGMMGAMDHQHDRMTCIRRRLHSNSRKPLFTFRTSRANSSSRILHYLSSICLHTVKPKASDMAHLEHSPTSLSALAPELLVQIFSACRWEDILALRQESLRSLFFEEFMLMCNLDIKVSAPYIEGARDMGPPSVFFDLRAIVVWPTCILCRTASELVCRK